jgi:hypothetical protein
VNLRKLFFAPGAFIGVRLRQAVLLASLVLPTHLARGQVNVTNADAWITIPSAYPRFIVGGVVESNAFMVLRAEVVAGRLKVIWPTSLSNGVATLSVSADKPGHWKARDWFRRAMAVKGNQWEGIVPVENLDVPLVYFVDYQNAATHSISPMRAANSRDLGLDDPTSFYWNFLDGFEEGLDSWSMISGKGDDSGLQLSSVAKNGRHSLRLSIPAGKRSVTVGTTRVRGWHFQQASGIRLWMKSLNGRGAARFTLLANAFTTNQVVVVSTEEQTVGDDWRMIDLPLASFPKLPEAEVDYFTVEMIAEGPREFLLDDVQLLISGQNDL